MAAFVFAGIDSDSHVELLAELARCLEDEVLLGLLRRGGPRAEILERIRQAEEGHETP
jgi:hypothetical protein